MDRGRLFAAVLLGLVAGGAGAQEVGAPVPRARPDWLSALHARHAAAKPAPAPAPQPLRMLADDELRSASAMGPSAQLYYLTMAGNAKNNNDTKWHALDKLLVPGWGLIGANVSAKDVLYGPGGATPTLNRDGSVNLAIPAWVGELNVQNLHVGQSEGANFGDLQFKGVDMGRTSVIVSPAK